MWRDGVRLTSGMPTCGSVGPYGHGRAWGGWAEATFRRFAVQRRDRILIRVRPSYIRTYVLSASDKKIPPRIF
jgi:hypothetical protein